METRQIGSMTFLKINVNDALEIFLSERKSKNSSKNTLLYYKRELGYFLEFLRKNKIIFVEEITPPIIREYFVELASHRNNGGIHASYRSIRTYLNFYENEFEPANWVNPIHKVKVQKYNSKPLEGISIEDVKKLLDACSGRNALRDKAILHCLVSSGCRATEFLDLNIDDINPIDGTVIIKHGKGDKFRYAFFGKEARKALRKYLAIHPNNIQPLWLNNQYERLTISGLRHMVIKYAKIAGVKRVGLHDFRRCFALSCYRKGINVFDISQLLGHSSIDVTRRYLNITIDDLKLAHSKGNPLDGI